MADDYGKGDPFWDLIAKAGSGYSIKGDELQEAVKEALEYEDEHGVGNWGAVLPYCPVTAKAIEIINNLK